MRLLILVPLIALSTTGCAAAARLAFASGQKPDITKIFENADENGDGVVSRAEYADARSKLFARLDRNGDGYLDNADVPSRLAARFSGQGNRLAQAKALLDKDGDGRISRDEFVNGSGLLFDRADTNHDGVVDAGELQALRAAVAAHRAQ
jgi:Ca2+-binding EF-hand superfamily protein